MSDFDIHDTVLDPITYDQIVLMAQNINPASGKSLRGELFDLLMTRMNEALELFDQHTEEIYRAAFPEEFEDEPETDIPAEKIEELAYRIYNLLIEEKMWVDVAIYFNGKSLSTDSKDENGKHQFRYNGEPFLKENVNPRDYFEYVGPYLSMSFEGPFYQAMNYMGGSIINKFSRLLEEYGLYFELGNAWNLTLGKI